MSLFFYDLGYLEVFVPNLLEIQQILMSLLFYDLQYLEVFVPNLLEIQQIFDVITFL